MLYTIALTPPAETAEKYLQASIGFRTNSRDSYGLIRGESSPYIAVAQFACESPDLVSQIWGKMCQKMSTENIVPFSPSFIGVTFAKSASPYENLTWVELSVKRGGKDSPIIKLHDAALDVLEQFGLKSLTPFGDDYQPCLPLARIDMSKYKSMQLWPENLCDNPGEFKLELGLSDENWQYCKTLKSFPPDAPPASLAAATVVLTPAEQLALTKKIDDLNRDIDAINGAVSADVMDKQKQSDRVYGSSDLSYLSYEENRIQERDNHIMYGAKTALRENIRQLFPELGFWSSIRVGMEESLVCGSSQKGKQIERPIYLHDGGARVAKTTLTITYVMEGEAWTPKISLSEFSLI